MIRTFDTDDDRRNAIREAVKQLADNLKLPIQMKAIGRGVGDKTPSYHVTLSDRDVFSYAFQGSAHFSTPAAIMASQLVVKVPLLYFSDDDRYGPVDTLYGIDPDAPLFVKVYLRVAKDVYNQWLEWRALKWPDVN